MGNISEDGNDGYVHPLTVKIFLNNIESDSNLALSKVIPSNGLTVYENEEVENHIGLSEFYWFKY